MRNIAQNAPGKYSGGEMEKFAGSGGVDKREFHSYNKDTPLQEVIGLPDQYFLYFLKSAELCIFSSDSGC